MGRIHMNDSGDRPDTITSVLTDDGGVMVGHTETKALSDYRVGA